MYELLFAQIEAHQDAGSLGVYCRTELILLFTRVLVPREIPMQAFWVRSFVAQISPTIKSTQVVGDAIKGSVRV